MGIGEHYVIELFSFPNPPKRLSSPESCGLRHLAFSVDNVEQKPNKLISKGLECEEIRIDEFTDKKFFFTQDPDDLPLEFYENFKTIKETKVLNLEMEPIENMKFTKNENL